MKGKKDSKSNKLDGKKGKRKLSTWEAIRAAKRDKKPKLSKSLENQEKSTPKKSLSPNNSNNLGNQESNPPPHPDTQVPNIIIQYGENFLDNPENANNIIKLKDRLTDKELKFIEYYLTGYHTQEKAMDLAGYSNLHPTYKRFLACKIIARHESQVEDHRNIARAIGAGEIFVIKGLMDLAKESTSGLVKRAALADLAKILGLTKEQLEGAGGVTIIFEGAGAPGATARLPGAPPLPPSQGEIKVLPASNKPMMITK